SSFGQAVFERICHVTDELDVELRPVRQLRAQRVEHAGARAGSFSHDRYQFRLELRLREDAGRTRASYPLGDLAEALRTGHDVRADGDRAGDVHTKTVFKILVGVVEDDRRLFPGTFQLLANLCDQLVEPLAITTRVLSIGGAVFRIGLAEDSLYFLDQNLGVQRIEPEVEVVVSLLVRMTGVMVMVVVTVRVFVTVMIVFMRLEGTAFAQRQLLEAVSVRQRNNLRIGRQGAERRDEIGLHPLADPEDDVGILKRLRVRGTQR